MTRLKTLRFSKSELWLLIDAMAYLYNSGEYERDQAPNIEAMLARLRENYGALVYAEREAAKTGA